MGNCSSAELSLGVEVFTALLDIVQRQHMNYEIVDEKKLLELRVTAHKYNKDEKKLIKLACDRLIDCKLKEIRDKKIEP